MEEGVMRNKIQPVVSPKTGENTGRVKWNSRGFQASIAGIPIGFRRRGWQGNDGRLLSFRSVPSSAKTVAGNGRYGRVKVAGRVGFPGLKLGQLTASLSLSVLHMHMFPLFPTYYFAYKLLNRLISFYIHRCYMYNTLELLYRVIFKNLPWGLGLLQVDVENLFICKKPSTVS